MKRETQYYIEYSIYLKYEGRYDARLPFIESHELLTEPDNYSFREKGFLILYNNLKSNTVLY